jgi:ParB-like chromosome segregation protein Spo0J|tara:strand:- start:795 stop:1757 length:963 start_codon:yes stop_codon:yes gene_type:complete
MESGDRAEGTAARSAEESVVVSTAACWLSPDAVIPYSTEARLSALPKRVMEGRPVETPRIFRSSGQGGFEVIYGWDIIVAHQETKKDQVSAILMEDSLQARLYWGVVKQAELLELPWTSVATSLVRAKERYRLSNEKCGTATLLGRTTVSRYINIATKLHPNLFALAEKGRLTYTDCRQLLTLSMERQSELALAAKEKVLDNLAIMKIAFPTQRQVQPQSGGGTVETSPRPEKSMDIKRLEINLSERIGYPVDISPSPEGEHAGEISCQFFDRQGMIDVMSKLRRGFSAKAEAKGRLTLQFESLDQFERLIEGHFSEDSD